MRNSLKIQIASLVAMLFIGLSSLMAQDITTVEASSQEISNHLDLEVVASIFGDATDLEDFEKKLNDPETQISNLDLNEDENVDYLRVVETSDNGTHLIVIQSVIGKDTYQDVATIEVEKDENEKAQVQVVGDVYLYGPDYIIEPVYVHRPVFFSLFWRPFYRPYRSAFYWGHYPHHYHHWNPVHHRVYRKSVHVHINTKHSYHRSYVRRSHSAVAMHKKTRRNDYAVKHPNKSYKYRAARVDNPNGTKKRAYGVKQADGDKYRVGGVNKPDGTKKRGYKVKKKDGTVRTVTSKNRNGEKLSKKSRKRRHSARSKTRRGYKKGKRSVKKSRKRAGRRGKKRN